MREFELEPGEHVVQETRKHWFLFAKGLLPYAIFAIMPFAIPNLISLAPSLTKYAAYFNYADPLVRAILGAWLLIIWTGAWGAFTRYYLDVWILTNKRLVDIDQQGFFSRQVSSLLLSRVQDVTITVHGFLPSVLSIGTITVQSAGATEEFTMQGIPHPEQMRDLILKYVAENPKGQSI